MHKRALIFGLVYSLLVICFKLFLQIGHYYATTFGFVFSHITSVLFIVPFIIVLLITVKKKEFDGNIGGREAMRIGLTMVAVAAIFITAYNYFEISRYGKEMAEAYYNGDRFKLFLIKKVPDITKHAAIISENIRMATEENTPFIASTVKLLPLLFIGGSAAFLTSVFIKRAR